MIILIITPLLLQQPEVIVNRLPKFFQTVLEPLQPLASPTKDTIAVRIYGPVDNRDRPHYVDYSGGMTCLANIMFSKTSEQTGTYHECISS